MSKEISSTTSRSTIIDSSIVETVLSNKFSKSNLRFIRDSHTRQTLLVCVNGTQKILNIRRNSSKYYNSHNFTVGVDKNNLTVFPNSIYVFIDEVKDCLYMVDGTVLLSYILEHSDELIVNKTNNSKYCMVIPKNNLFNLIKDNKDSVIHYNKNIAKLLEVNRDESIFEGV